jgi:hypothetical protein
MSGVLDLRGAAVIVTGASSGSTIHEYAALQAADGFQWSADPDGTFDWMIRFLDRGLRAMCPPAGNAVD